MVGAAIGDLGDAIGQVAIQTQRDKDYADANQARALLNEVDNENERMMIEDENGQFPVPPDQWQDQAKARYETATAAIDEMKVSSDVRERIGLDLRRKSDNMRTTIAYRFGDHQRRRARRFDNEALEKLANPKESGITDIDEMLAEARPIIQEQVPHNMSQAGADMALFKLKNTFKENKETWEEEQFEDMMADPETVIQSSIEMDRSLGITDDSIVVVSSIDKDGNLVENIRTKEVERTLEPTALRMERADKLRRAAHYRQAWKANEIHHKILDREIRTPEGVNRAVIEAQVSKDQAAKLRAVQSEVLENLANMTLPDPAGVAVATAAVDGFRGWDYPDRAKRADKVNELTSMITDATQGNTEAAKLFRAELIAKVKERNVDDPPVFNLENPSETKAFFNNMFDSLMEVHPVFGPTDIVDVGDLAWLWGADGSKEERMAVAEKNQRQVDAFRFWLWGRYEDHARRFPPGEKDAIEDDVGFQKKLIEWMGAYQAITPGIFERDVAEELGLKINLTPAEGGKTPAQIEELLNMPGWRETSDPDPARLGP
jgi:hypothetical protein